MANLVNIYIDKLMKAIYDGKTKEIEFYAAGGSKRIITAYYESEHKYLIYDPFHKSYNPIHTSVMIGFIFQDMWKIVNIKWK